MISVTPVSQAPVSQAPVSQAPVSQAAPPSGSSPSARPSVVPIAQSTGQTPPGSSVVGSGQAQPTDQQVQHAVNQANTQMAGLNEQISFSYVKQIGQLVVQVTDKRSGELIRQIPSKLFVAEEIAARAFLGTLLNRKA